MTVRPCGLRERRGGAANGFGFDFASSFTDVFDDLFGEFMGGRRARRQNRGGDLRYNLEITLEDAFAARARRSASTPPYLRILRGTGAEPGSKPEQCATCSGAGKVRAQQGFFTIERTCPNAGARAAPSAIPANPAAARAMCRRSARSRSIFRPAWRKARASGSPAKARPA
jgi:molecular chaperone DnaJ